MYHIKLKHFAISNTQIVHRISIVPIVQQGLLVVRDTLVNITLELNLKLMRNRHVA